MRGLGLRSGVLSNISFSGIALSRRVAALTPGHTFEFIIASSEIVFRKPHPQIFGYAIDRAGLPPEDIWFIGDNTLCDIEGAANAGMVPIWYLCGSDNPFHDHRMPDRPTVPHLEISDWRQLVTILNELAQG